MLNERINVNPTFLGHKVTERSQDSLTKRYRANLSPRIEAVSQIAAKALQEGGCGTFRIRKIRQVTTHEIATTDLPLLSQVVITALRAARQANNDPTSDAYKRALKESIDASVRNEINKRTPIIVKRRGTRS